jgi:alkaline phosphatase
LAPSPAAPARWTRKSAATSARSPGWSTPWIPRCLMSQASARSQRASYSPATRQDSRARLRSHAPMAQRRNQHPRARPSATDSAAAATAKSTTPST